MHRDLQFGLTLGAAVIACGLGVVWALADKPHVEQRVPSWKSSTDEQTRFADTPYTALIAPASEPIVSSTSQSWETLLEEALPYGRADFDDRSKSALNQLRVLVKENSALRSELMRRLLAYPDERTKS